MVCPECGGKVHAPDIVHTPDNETYRKRKCVDCGFIFYTVEYEVEFDRKVQYLWNENHRLNKIGGKK